MAVMKDMLIEISEEVMSLIKREFNDVDEDETCEMIQEGIMEGVAPIDIYDEIVDFHVFGTPLSWRSEGWQPMKVVLA